MPWLTPSDQGMIELAYAAAREIDEAEARAAEYGMLRDLIDPEDEATWKRLERLEAHCNVTKVVGWLGPQIQGYLSQLGGSPAARKAIEQTKAKTSGRLEELQRGLNGAVR